MFYFVFISQEASKSTGHSKLLAADHNEVFEVMVEDVSPRYWEEYLANKADYMKLLEAKTQNHCELIASWRFIYGDVNFRAMHLFKYSNVRQRPSKKIVKFIRYDILCYFCKIISPIFAKNQSKIDFYAKK